MKSEHPFESVGISESQPNLPWYLIYTKPRQEQIAMINLQNQPFEAYLPLYKVVKKSTGSNVGHAASLEPMFPRYLFARPEHSSQSVSAIRSTRGVTTIVHFGHELAVVKPEMVEAIRQAELVRNSRFSAQGPSYEQGSRVQIRVGPLAGLGGVVQIVSNKRVTLLLEFLGQEQKVQIDPRHLNLA